MKCAFVGNVMIRKEARHMNVLKKYKKILIVIIALCTIAIAVIMVRTIAIPRVNGDSIAGRNIYTTDSFALAEGSYLFDIEISNIHCGQWGNPDQIGQITLCKNGMATDNCIITATDEPTLHITFDMDAEKTLNATLICEAFSGCSFRVKDITYSRYDAHMVFDPSKSAIEDIKERYGSIISDNKFFIVSSNDTEYYSSNYAKEKKVFDRTDIQGLLLQEALEGVSGFLLVDNNDYDAMFTLCDKYYLAGSNAECVLFLSRDLVPMANDAGFEVISTLGSLPLSILNQNNSLSLPLGTYEIAIPSQESKVPLFLADFKTWVLQQFDAEHPSVIYEAPGANTSVILALNAGDELWVSRTVKGMEINLSSMSFSTDNGAYQDGSIYIGPAEGLNMYGPYLPWGKGQYNLKISADVLTDLSDRQATDLVATFDVVSNYAIVANADLSVQDAENNHIEISLPFQSTLGPIEFRCTNHEGISLKINRIYVEDSKQ